MDTLKTKESRLVLAPFFHHNQTSFPAIDSLRTARQPVLQQDEQWLLIFVWNADILPPKSSLGAWLDYTEKKMPRTKDLYLFVLFYFFPDWYCVPVPAVPGADDHLRPADHLHNGRSHLCAEPCVLCWACLPHPRLWHVGAWQQVQQWHSRTACQVRGSVDTCWLYSYEEDNLSGYRNMLIFFLYYYLSALRSYMVVSVF